MIGEISNPSSNALLRVENLVQRFRVPAGVIEAVAGVSFDIDRKETLGLVGESGCGKSSIGRAALQLPAPTEGQVLFEGRNLGAVPKKELRQLRARMQVIFQDPVSALNPRRKVRDIVAEGLTVHRVSRAESRQRVDEALRAVGLDPDTVGDRKAHQFSGGQCQRIAIARAIVLRPSLIVCDEPVASLDVSIQGQVLNLLNDAREQYELSLLFISHDLRVVRSISDRIAVMYLGKIVEIGPAHLVADSPRHPYTQALIESVPDIDDPDKAEPAVRGDVPSALRPPSGCRFRTRCPRAAEICSIEEPVLKADLGGNHHVACHFSLAPGESAVSAQ